MESSQERFMRELLEEFRNEVSEHLDVLVNGLLLLEKGVTEEEAKKTIETVFREVHSAKGAARAVNNTHIENLCQGIEVVFSELKSGRMKIAPPVIDLLHKAADQLTLLVDDLSSKNKSVSSAELLEMITELSNAGKGSFGFAEMPVTVASEKLKLSEIKEMSPDPVHQTSEAPGNLTRNESVRLSMEKLQSLLDQADEFIVSKSMDKLLSDDLLRLLSDFSTIRKSVYTRLRSIRSSGRMDPIEMEGFQGWLDESLAMGNDRLTRLARLAHQKSFNQSKITDDLLLELKKILLVPASTLLGILPKLVRDLSKQQLKQVHLEISGGEIEIDRRILEELKDPLIHIIRNCIDHGIEDPATRSLGNKPVQGKILVRVEKDNDTEALIRIHDDGRGIDPETVLFFARNQGIITEESAAKMSAEEIVNLVFRSGLSTSPKVTEISGRGLGLAIVSEKVREIGGKIHLESEKGKGSSFFMRIPLTIRTFKGLLIKTGEHPLLVPINHVQRVFRYDPANLITVDNRLAMKHGPSVLFLRDLGEYLGYSISFGQTFRKPDYILVIEQGEKNAAFFIDDVKGDVEGIIKPMGSQLLHVRHISGASLLGDGKVVPVINVPEILNSILSDTGMKNVVVSPVAGSGGPKGRILIVEDSITSRSLLRNILESAGYKVTTAVDGLDAFDKLQQETPDLVVSDIEMPRMNGFELTSRIRGEPLLRSLPLILVTGLESAEERQKGLEAGANALIVKNSFQGADLISAIERLI